MNSSSRVLKLGVFYDGNFLLHTSNYYNYIHPRGNRLSLSGLHNFIRHRVAEEEEVDVKWCSIVESHYFRGRINAVEASQRGSQLYNDRVFDDILMSEGVQPHYLPLRNVLGRKEERGIDVWLSLESMELAIRGQIDVVVLVVANADYVPLLRKLTSLGVRVMLLSWEFDYVNDDGTRMVTKTSHELLQIATYPVAMHEVINCGLEQDNALITGLFVPSEALADTPSQQPAPSSEGKPIERSEIMSLKNGFGFIKYPNNNLFFHYQDVLGDFSELKVGDTVEFNIDKNSMKQDVAKNVRKIE